MKRFLLILFVLVLLAGGAAAFVAERYYTAAETPYRSATADRSLLLEIPPGMGTQAIGQKLIAAGLIRDDWTYRVAIWRSGQARHLQAGEYRFDAPLSPLDVIGKIARGEVDLVPVTFPEGRYLKYVIAVRD